MTGAPTTLTNIKLMYKDDDLGTGARAGGHDEDLPGNVSVGLLGRLNGKVEEELAQEQRI